MNKSYLIAGGASVASLTIGGVGGYLIAKKKFNATVDGLIALEVQKTKKYFSVLLMEAEKKARPLTSLTPVEDESPQETEELTAEDQEVITKGREKLREAATALVNYQGFSDKPSLTDVVSSNIFTKDTPKKKLPPRDPTGKFIPAKSTEEAEQTPYLISAEDFLLNDPEHDQENLKYFVKDNTLIDYSNETVEISRVGEVNLTLFPATEKDEPSIICVRNEGLGIDYEILLTSESLTEYMGLGEEEDEEIDDYADNET